MIEDIIKAMARLAKKQAEQIADDEQALEVKYLYSEWKCGTNYVTGDRKNYNGKLYKCLVDHTSQENWMPNVSPSLWAEVLIPNPEVVPEWKQPDSTNSYMKGDKVSHNGLIWESTVDGNVWEPGAIGTESLWEIL